MTTKLKKTEPEKHEKKPEEKKPKALRRFDYKLIVLPLSLASQDKESRLDQMGAMGWELVALGGETAVFKRLIE